jgi:glycosyltransferase involved in cell wall biosynthesis
MKTIGLCMIVKNEMHVMRRCIESALPIIDYVLVVDTGSDDGTPAVVRHILATHNIPGEVVEEPWQDFAFNRTFALRKLQERTEIDYSLMIDADQVVLFDRDFSVQQFKAELKRDLYDIKLNTGPIEYFVPHLTSNRMNVIYKGVLHEYREVPDGCSRGTVSGLLLKECHDSARSRNPQKFQHDAAVLEKVLEIETDSFLISRYKFYLAQSYKDFGDAERALKTYLERAELGFWDEEVFLSFYYAAQMKEILKHLGPDIIETYLRAHQACPRRAESLFGAARYCRNTGNYEQGYALIKRALSQPCPDGGLFIERWIYDHGLLDEFAVLAYWCGRYGESLDACMQLLKEGKTPVNQHERIHQNARFAVDKLRLAGVATDQISVSQT